MLPLIIFSFVENCLIGSFHKIMFKDNAKYNCFSIDTFYLQVLTKSLIKGEKKNKL
jgi:hypothetical protein